MYEVVIINNNEIQIHIVQSFYGLTTLIVTKSFLTFSNTENMLYNIPKVLSNPLWKKTLLVTFLWSFKIKM